MRKIRNYSQLKFIEDGITICVNDEHFCKKK